MEQKRLISHGEAEQMMRRAGYPREQIENALRQLPDPIDAERDSDVLVKYGMSPGALMDRMSGSP